ncbi:YolD-like family protein [Chengkuizengella axinellae]|uniref:YolD-like family protein n=1 Tax=Chengkuizengella axinellae TaxID=3064388 RepID=A0ABT9J5W5_9BACL|nr:YolD-like family protein [Chengkuizengella sp. 2205SS18-9]MDP5276344.1 YolD-like family protein [Chengkuizengella sp. 2205SS18-9]
MKENKLTEGSNMMWEASRIMLPEHKELMNHFQKERNRKTKPELAEEEINIISQQLSQSMMEQTKITIELFTAFGENTLKTGTVTKFDIQLRQIKLESKDDYEWIKFSEILSVR